MAFRTSFGSTRSCEPATTNMTVSNFTVTYSVTLLLPTVCENVTAHEGHEAHESTTARPVPLVPELTVVSTRNTEILKHVSVWAFGGQADSDFSPPLNLKEKVY